MSKKDVLKYLERISSVMRITYRQHLTREGLQLVHLETLTYFSTCNKYSDSPQHVAEYLGLTKGTVSQTINILDSLGLVTKNVDPRDRRKLHITPTLSGKRLLSKFEHIIKIDDPDGDDLTDNQALAESLNSILRALQKANGYKTFGACKTCLHHQVSDGKRMCLLTKEELTEPEKDMICHEHTPHHAHSVNPSS